MTNKLSEKIAANTLRISQSLIGKTISEIMQDKDKSIIHTFCCSKEQSDTETDASILLFISEGISFGCYFPADEDCKLVNITIRQKDVEVYYNYCNSLFKAHETADNCWYNSELGTFIKLFFDKEENSYILNIMDLNEDLSNTPHSNGVD